MKNLKKHKREKLTILCEKLLQLVLCHHPVIPPFSWDHQLLLEEKENYEKAFVKRILSNFFAFVFFANF